MSFIARPQVDEEEGSLESLAAVCLKDLPPLPKPLWDKHLQLGTAPLLGRESMGILGNLWTSLGTYGNLWESLGQRW